jgi:hypothetical protein
MADSTPDVPDDVTTSQAEDGTTWVEIASVGTADEAKLLQGFLEAEEIPSQVEDVKFDEMPINFGAMGEIRVYVLQDDENRAQQLLRERERQYENLDDDEETLVTNDGVAAIDENAQAESDDGAER